MSVREVNKSIGLYHIEGRTPHQLANALVEYTDNTSPEHIADAKLIREFVEFGGRINGMSMVVRSPLVEGGRRDVIVEVTPYGGIVEMTDGSTPEACRMMATELDTISSVILLERPGIHTDRNLFTATNTSTHRSLQIRTQPSK